MSNLIQLEQQLLAHDFQRTNLPSILLLGKEDLSIATLSDLCKNLEISLAETNTTFSEICAFSPDIFVPNRIVGIFWSCRRFRVFGFEVGKTSLSRSDVC